MEISQYLDLFISEAQDHLQEMNQALLALEESPDDLSHLELFFRAAHTVKGMSATMGFPEMAGLAHDMEDVLDALRRRERRLTTELADLLFRCLDILAEQLRGIAAGEGIHGDTTALQAQLRSAEAAPAAVAALPPLAVLEEGWEVAVEVAPDCVLKGPRAFLVLRKLAAAAPVQGSDPPAAALRAGEYEESFRVFFAATADPEVLRRAALSVAEIPAVTVRPVGPGQAKAFPQTVLAGVEAGTVVAGPPPAPLAAQQEQAAPAPAAEEPLAAAPTAPVVRVKVALLDQLLEAVADLVINRSHLVQVARKHDLPGLKEAVEAHGSALDRLQEAVLTMRMTPVAQVFNRFPRMVRDLARQQGKEVRFEMEGAEIELDRTILDKITDPLVHLLRNAVDHGVEAPEERRQAGKPGPAWILLRAQRVQDKAVIEVRDDGRGMSPQRIAQVAVERGLITAQDAAEMDDAAIFELICRPGFSTKAEVTGVSGRGVGMEVVKQVMDEIGGTLEIGSQAGQGSHFRLVFPLTMAILPVLLVRVAGETYALPLTHVVRTAEPPAGEVRQLHHQPVLHWEERMLPLVSLAELLGAAGGEANKALTGETLSVVVVERGRQRYGLVVDEIVGKEEVVLKPLGGMLQQIEGLAGATIRGEGEVVLVLDVPGLVRRL